MEELIIKEAMGLGVLGVGAVILFKTFLQEKSDDKLYYREQIEKTQKVYQDNLQADRETYVESIKEISGAISLLSNKIENVEHDITEIKDELKKM